MTFKVGYFCPPCQWPSKPETTTIDESEASDTNGNFCPMQSRLSSVTLHMINRRRPNIASASIGTSVCWILQQGRTSWASHVRSQTSSSIEKVILLQEKIMLRMNVLRYSPRDKRKRLIFEAGLLFSSQWPSTPEVTTIGKSEASHSNQCRFQSQLPHTVSFVVYGPPQDQKKASECNQRINWIERLCISTSRTIFTWRTTHSY